ncbi:MAG TPA: response regulator [Steroidobacteraceae bacterium]
MPTTIHVVDDDASFRTAIARQLRVTGYDVVQYESANQLLDRLPVDVGTCCILLDVQIPDLPGPQLQMRLAALGSTLPIIFLTGYGDIPTSVHAIKAGAADFLTKPVAMPTLLGAIELAISRHLAARTQDARLEKLRCLVATLTPRERAVFELVVRGRMNKQIAHALGTTERTIKAHRHKVMLKIGVASLADLAAIAERLGFLNTPPAIVELNMSRGLQ